MTQKLTQTTIKDAIPWLIIKHTICMDIDGDTSESSTSCVVPYQNTVI